MPISARKMDFFDENGNLTPWLVRASSDFKDFFSYVIFLLKFQRMFWGKVGHMVKPPSECFQFSQKWAIFENVEKKRVQK